MWVVSIKSIYFPRISFLTSLKAKHIRNLAILFGKVLKKKNKDHKQMITSYRLVIGFLLA